MAEQWDAQGKTFVITGAASGLGALYAEAFLKEGAKNVIILDVAETVGKATADRLNATYPGRVVFMKCDVGKEEEINETFNRVVDQYKQVDVIINNAGIMSDAPSMWRTACNVNWQGLVSFTMKGVKHMRRDEGGVGGTIVNVASNAALFKFRQLPIYSGSKMAVLHFSQCLAIEPFFEQTGVRILTICFGATKTPLLEGLRARAYDQTTGNELDQLEKEAQATFQKPESAVAACLKMYREGVNGSIWLSVNNKTGEDITPSISGVFQEFEKLYT